MKKIVLDKKRLLLCILLLLVCCLLTFFFTRALSVRTVRLDLTEKLSPRPATKDGPFPLLGIDAGEDGVELTDSGWLMLHIAVNSDKHWLRYGPTGENVGVYWVDNNSLNMLGARFNNLDGILMVHGPEAVVGILGVGDDYYYALLTLPEGQYILPCMRESTLSPDKPISFAEFQQRLRRPEETGSGSEPII